MRQATALAVKLAFTTLIFGATLPILGLTYFPTAMLLAAVTTLLSWMIGDLIILPMFGNVAATAADAGMALLMVPILAIPMGTMVLPLGAWAAALGLGAAEWFFHRWLVASDILC